MGIDHRPILRSQVMNGVRSISCSSGQQVIGAGMNHAFLPLINDYDLTTRRMDVDAPRPRCPFCGRPMQFRFSELSTLQTFDCNGCQVLLNVPSQLVFRESPRLCSRETD